MGIECLTPTTLSCDNTSAIQIADDPSKHELTKHIGVDASFTRYHRRTKTIDLQFIPSKCQIADFFTKAQTWDSHCVVISKLNMFDPP